MNQCCHHILGKSQCKNPGVLRDYTGKLYCRHHAPLDAVVSGGDKFIMFRARGIPPDYFKLARLLLDRAQDKKLTFQELDALKAILNK